jgi:cell division protein FtsQ
MIESTVALRPAAPSARSALPVVVPVRTNHAPLVPRAASAKAALARRRLFERRVHGRFRSLAAPRPGVGLVLGAVLFAAIGLYGVVRGGHSEAAMAAVAEMSNWLARQSGFAITSITVTGRQRLSEQEILDAAGITANSSLLFVNAAAVRDELEHVALIKQATVSKFFPNRLVIGVVEREPYALWQKDGDVFVIAADGTVIDSRKDQRFDGLPFVVGDGANLRAAEYVRLLASSGDLRDKIRAGTLVAQRRWNLTMSAGMIVKLPEVEPQSALAELATLQRDSHVIDRDLLSLDMRLSGRMVARLSEEAAAARAEALSHRAKLRGGRV